MGNSPKPVPQREAGFFILGNPSQRIITWTILENEDKARFPAIRRGARFQILFLQCTTH